MAEATPTPGLPEKPSEGLAAQAKDTEPASYRTTPTSSPAVVREEAWDVSKREPTDDNTIAAALIKKSWRKRLPKANESLPHIDPTAPAESGVQTVEMTAAVPDEPSVTFVPDPPHNRYDQWIDWNNWSQFANAPSLNDPRTSSQILADEKRQARRKKSIEATAPATFYAPAFENNDKKLRELFTQNPKDVLAIARLRNAQAILESLMRFGKTPALSDLPYPDVAIAEGIPPDAHGHS
jgi:hypothetical protein